MMYKMKDKLIEWAKKISANKNDLDKTMFDDLMKAVLGRIDRYGWQNAKDYLLGDIPAKSSQMVGPRLLGINAKIIYDKVWSLCRKSKESEGEPKNV